MTDEELQGYYEAHKERYREPEQRQIRYVTIPVQRFTQHYEPAAEDVSEYYTSHLDSVPAPGASAGTAYPLQSRVISRRGARGASPERAPKRY